MAIKVFVPSPPASSFEAENVKTATSSTREAASPEKSRITPFGVEFFGRVQKTSLWFGALMGALLWSATQSANSTFSFALGGAVSLAMLQSQVWFVTSLVRPKSEGRPNASKMLWIVQPVKFAILMALLSWSLNAQNLNAAVFAVGVSLTPFVIFAKALGRMLAFEARPLSEVYGTQRRVAERDS